MGQAMKILNKFELDMLLKSDKTNFNNFYKIELVQMLERARELLQTLDKAGD